MTDATLPNNLRELLTDEPKLLEVGAALRHLKQHPGYALLMELLQRGAQDALRAGFRDRENLDRYAAVVEVYEALPRQIDAIIEAEGETRAARRLVNDEVGGMRLGGGSTVVSS